VAGVDERKRNGFTPKYSPGQYDPGSGVNPKKGDKPGQEFKESGAGGVTGGGIPYKGNGENESRSD
jgi:hypothetical protein